MRYIFIHGLGQHPSSWNPTISYMKKQEDVICLDLFALLRDKDVTYANLYHAFSKYCACISEPLNLCGLSLGAVLALNYAIDYPEKVKTLTLIGAQYKMPKALLKFQNIIFYLMPGAVFQKMGFKKKYFIQLTNSMIDLDFRERLKNISCSTLILCGEKDYVNKSASKNLVKRIEYAKIKFVENAGHEVNREAPKKLAEILEVFYKRY